jgi:hypothetical protein
MFKTCSLYGVAGILKNSTLWVIFSSWFCMVHVLVLFWGLTVSGVEVPTLWLTQYRLYLRKNEVEEGGKPDIWVSQ